MGWFTKGKAPSKNSAGAKMHRAEQRAAKEAAGEAIIEDFGKALAKYAKSHSASDKQECLRLANDVRRAEAKSPAEVKRDLASVGIRI